MLRFAINNNKKQKTSLPIRGQQGNSSSTPKKQQNEAPANNNSEPSTKLSSDLTILPSRTLQLSAFSTIEELLNYSNAMDNILKNIPSLEMTTELNALLLQWYGALQTHQNSLNLSDYSHFKEDVVLELFKVLRYFLLSSDQQLVNVFITFQKTIPLSGTVLILSLLNQLLQYEDLLNGDVKYDINRCQKCGEIYTVLLKLCSTSDIKSMVPSHILQDACRCLQYIFQYGIKDITNALVVNGFTAVAQVVWSLTLPQVNATRCQPLVGVCSSIFDMLRKLMELNDDNNFIAQYIEQIILLIWTFCEYANVNKNEIIDVDDWFAVFLTVLKRFNRNPKIIGNIMAIIRNIADSTDINLVLTNQQRQLFLDFIVAFQGNGVVVKQTLRALLSFRMDETVVEMVSLKLTIPVLMNILRLHCTNEDITIYVCSLIIVESNNSGGYVGEYDDLVKFGDQLLSLARKYGKSIRTVGLVGELLILMKGPRDQIYIELSTISAIDSIQIFLELLRHHNDAKSTHITISLVNRPVSMIIIDIIKLHNPSSYNLDDANNVEIIGNMLQASTDVDLSAFLCNLLAASGPNRKRVPLKRSYGALALSALDAAIRLQHLTPIPLASSVVNFIQNVIVVEKPPIVQALLASKSRRWKGLCMLLRPLKQQPTFIDHWAAIMTVVLQDDGDTVKLQIDVSDMCDDIIEVIAQHSDKISVFMVFGVLLRMITDTESMKVASWAVKSPINFHKAICFLLSKITKKSHEDELRSIMRLVHTFNEHQSVVNLFRASELFPAVLLKKFKLYSSNQTLIGDMLYMLADLLYLTSETPLNDEYHMMLPVLVDLLKKHKAALNHIPLYVCGIIEAIVSNPNCAVKLADIHGIYELLVDVLKRQSTQDSDIFAYVLRIIHSVSVLSDSNRNRFIAVGGFMDSMINLVLKQKFEDVSFRLGLMAFDTFTHCVEMRQKVCITACPIGTRLMEYCRGFSAAPDTIYVCKIIGGLSEDNATGSRIFGRLPGLLEWAVATLKTYKRATDGFDAGALAAICFMLTQLATQSDNRTTICNSGGMYDALYCSLIGATERISSLNEPILNLIQVLSHDQGMCIFAGNKFNQVTSLLLAAVPAHISLHKSTKHIFVILTNISRAAIDRLETEFSTESLLEHCVLIWQFFTEYLMTIIHIETIGVMTQCLIDMVVDINSVLSKWLIDTVSAWDWFVIVMGIKAVRSHKNVCSMLLQLSLIVLQRKRFHENSRIGSAVYGVVYDALNLYYADSSIAISCADLILQIGRRLPYLPRPCDSLDWYSLISNLLVHHQANKDVVYLVCQLCSSKHCVILSSCPDKYHMLLTKCLSYLHRYSNDQRFVVNLLKSCKRLSILGVGNDENVVPTETLAQLLSNCHDNPVTLSMVCDAMHVVINPTLVVEQLSVATRLLVLNNISAAASKYMENRDSLLTLSSIASVIVNTDDSFHITSASFEVWLQVLTRYVDDISLVTYVTTMLSGLLKESDSLSSLGSSAPAWVSVLLLALSRHSNVQYMLFLVCECIISIGILSQTKLSPLSNDIGIVLTLLKDPSYSDCVCMTLLLMLSHIALHNEDDITELFEALIVVMHKLSANDCVIFVCFQIALDYLTVLMTLPQVIVQMITFIPHLISYWQSQVNVPSRNDVVLKLISVDSFRKGIEDLCPNCTQFICENIVIYTEIDIGIALKLAEMLITICKNPYDAPLWVAGLVEALQHIQNHLEMHSPESALILPLMLFGDPEGALQNACGQMDLAALIAFVEHIIDNEVAIEQLMPRMVELSLKQTNLTPSLITVMAKLSERYYMSMGICANACTVIANAIAICDASVTPTLRRARFTEGNESSDSWLRLIESQFNIIAHQSQVSGSIVVPVGTVCSCLHQLLLYVHRLSIVNYDAYRRYFHCVIQLMRWWQAMSTQSSYPCIGEMLAEIVCPMFKLLRAVHSILVDNNLVSPLLSDDETGTTNSTSVRECIITTVRMIDLTDDDTVTTLCQLVENVVERLEDDVVIPSELIQIVLQCLNSLVFHSNNPMSCLYVAQALETVSRVSMMEVEKVDAGLSISLSVALGKFIDNVAVVVAILSILSICRNCAVDTQQYYCGIWDYADIYFDVLYRHRTNDVLVMKIVALLTVAIPHVDPSVVAIVLEHNAQRIVNVKHKHLYNNEVVIAIDKLMRGASFTDDISTPSVPIADQACSHVSYNQSNDGGSFRIIFASEIQITSVLDVNIFAATWRHSSVVLKVCRAKPSVADTTLRAHASLLSSLRHPRIISLLGMCEDELRWCDESFHGALVLEYMEKGNLRNVLNKEYQLMSWSSKLAIAVDIAEGMQFLHESNIVHGSLNSSNVLIDSFGRAKLTGINVHQTSITAKKAGSYREDDILAFGTILWELITGKLVPSVNNSKTKAAKPNASVKLQLSVQETQSCPFPVIIQLATDCLSIQGAQRPMFTKIFSELKGVLIAQWKDPHRALDIPEGFICPITHDIMKDPVMLLDGHSYERAAIMDWLEKKDRSPMTNQVLQSRIVLDNYALRTAIEAFRSCNPSL